MKAKIFLLGFILTILWISSHAQSAIATKNIGIDSITGLQQRVEVWQITIDSKASIVTIVYQIKTLSPNGVVVATSENKTYTRYNQEGKMNFDILRSSEVGQEIIGMINIDLADYPHLEQ